MSVVPAVVLPALVLVVLALAAFTGSGRGGERGSGVTM